AEPMIELRRQGHVAPIAGAVRRLRDGRTPAPADHLVAAIERRGHALDDRVAAAALRLAIGLELGDLRLDLAFLRGELLAQRLVLRLGRLELRARRRGVAVDALDLVLAIAHELSELLQLALRGLA